MKRDLIFANLMRTTVGSRCACARYLRNLITCDRVQLSVNAERDITHACLGV